MTVAAEVDTAAAAVTTVVAAVDTVEAEAVVSPIEEGSARVSCGGLEAKMSCMLYCLKKATGWRKHTKVLQGFSCFMEWQGITLIPVLQCSRS
jgi:hypothetical protein